MARAQSSDGKSAASGRLPPGRHGLPREVVSQHQRDRLLAGLVE